MHRPAGTVIALAAALTAALTTPALAEKAPPPWRLGTALGVPAWLALHVEQLARAEHLEGDYRADAAADGDGDASAVSVRTLLGADLRAGIVRAGLELIDARTYAAAGTALDTTLVDPLDLLQGWAGVHLDDVGRPGASLEVRAGRMTIDLGSRRLVARNRFRATINAFTGVDATYAWRAAGAPTGAGGDAPGHVLRALAVVPVTRLPGDAEGLADNALELDEENTDARLGALFYATPPVLAGGSGELYAIGLHEADGEVASRDRRLLTLGGRWQRRPAPGQLDGELEVAAQLGTSRATVADDDVTDLTHRALLVHAEVGVSPAITAQPRLALLYEHATGDADPTDGRQGRFDPLFGARRWDLAPTGVYGAIARSNVVSPGVRVSVAPTPRLEAVVFYRLLWLASARDAWTPARVQDPTGASGRFIGEHVEAAVRWSVLPRVLGLELGAAHLRRGEFARTAPRTRAEAATYVFSMLSVTI